MSVMDKGPWEVLQRDEYVWIVSEDFTHDVTLAIYGDFADYGEKVRYAEELVDRMNKMPQDV